MGGIMRLRNKKTGERGIVSHFDNQSIVIYPVDENWNAKGDKKYVYASLAELNEEWEDAPEEPKECWYINEFGTPTKADFVGRETLYDKCRKNFGNYFETKEEAEKAVEKLKAWKRLKDKGFRFDNWDLDADDEDVNVLLRSDKYKGNQVYVLEKDLDLLFCTEENS